MKQLTTSKLSFSSKDKLVSLFELRILDFVWTGEEGEGSFLSEAITDGGISLRLLAFLSSRSALIDLRIEK